MTLRGLLIIIIFYVIFVLTLRAKAAEQDIKVAIQAPSHPSLSKEITVEAMYDNLDKTSTIVLIACGSTIKMVIPDKMIRSQDPEIDLVANMAIAKACKDKN